MYKRLSFLMFFLITVVSSAQQLNCEIIINAEPTGNANVNVFETLQNSLTEFVNQTDWADVDLRPHERINCSMFINITSYDANSFSGSIQVQASRPVFGSSMVSPIFNFNDESFSFDYTEYESLDFSLSSYNSNLVSVISYYVYTILGLDADTFEEEGGTPYFELANQIVNTAQQGNYTGWRATDGNNSRYQLNADLLSNAFVGYRRALYTYHREGMDLMHSAPSTGKENIAEALMELRDMNASRPNSLLLRTFFDAKANEIQQVFSGGPTVSVREILDALNTMAPTFSDNWANIRY